MITIEMLGRIRRMYLRDKVSLHEITKRTGLSRNTVRRWLRTPQDMQVPTYSRAVISLPSWSSRSRPMRCGPNRIDAREGHSSGKTSSTRSIKTAHRSMARAGRAQ